MTNASSILNRTCEVISFGGTIKDPMPNSVWHYGGRVTTPFYYFSNGDRVGTKLRFDLFISPEKLGASAGGRTPDLLITNQLLYH